uniref:Thymocyte nuclear protein 1 n=1 Tax=Pogona vitticeps TaxID=103695 RepID=A0A6J0TW63_9SAUR
MPPRGKKRRRATSTAVKEPASKAAKGEAQKDSEESRSSRVKTKRVESRNVPESAQGEVGAKQEGSKKVYTHWLMKSEPESRLEKGVDVKARNFLRAMKVGQEAFFYHSNCKGPGIAGIVKITKEAYPDHTQFDKTDPHYDSSSSKENPKWSMVDVQFVRMTKRFIPLAELKAHHQVHKTSGGPLKEMALFTRQRLSIQPLTDEEFEFILSLEEKKP